MKEIARVITRGDEIIVRDKHNNVEVRGVVLYAGNRGSTEESDWFIVLRRNDGQEVLVQERFDDVTIDIRFATLRMF
jgi:hypothetical protein